MAGRAIGGITEPLYITPEQVQQQIAIESAWEAGLHTGAGLCPPEMVREVIDEAEGDGLALSAEQRQLVEQWCGSGHHRSGAPVPARPSPCALQLRHGAGPATP